MMVMNNSEDDLQSEGLEEGVPEVLNEAEKNVKSFQESRGRKPETKRAVRADGGEISSCTHSHSPLLSPLHTSTDSHFPLSSSVATPSMKTKLQVDQR